MGSLLRAAQAFRLQQVAKRVRAGERDENAFLSDQGSTLGVDEPHTPKVLARLNAQGRTVENEDEALFELYETLLLAGHPVPDKSARRCVQRVIAKADQPRHARACALMALCIEQGMLDWATSAWAQQVEIDQPSSLHTPMKDRHALFADAVGDAARAGNLGMLQQLVALLPEDQETRRKRLTSATQPIYKAVWGGHSACVSLLCGLMSEDQWQRTSASNQKSPLVMLAAGEGNEPLVRQLLAWGSDLHALNERGNRNIVLAALGGKQPQVVPFLLALGADPGPAKAGELSPLHLACWNGFDEPLAHLVKAGAEVDYQDAQGRTALLMAAMVGMEACVAALVKAGASLDLADTEGYTPLMWAARNDRVEASTVLMNAGANLDARSLAGETVLDVARVQVKALIEQRLMEQATVQNNRGKNGPRL